MAAGSVAGETSTLSRPAAPVRTAAKPRWVDPVLRAARLATARAADLARRDRRRPGIHPLDGLRGLAIALVLAAHGGIRGVHGGFVGVDLFFVLSGFLITALLIDELGRTGRISLSAFWVRRGRRLLPALVLMVLAVAASHEFLPPGAATGLRGDAVAAFLWVANWRFVSEQAGYFTQGGTASPLQHTWSLGVEEQYYLVWPLLLVAVTLAWAAGAQRSGRRVTVGAVRLTTVIVAIVGTVTSAVAAVVLARSGSDNHVYFGTDTRAQALLIGAGAAALLVQDWPALMAGWPVVRSRRARRAARMLPVVGLVVLAAVAHRATGTVEEFRSGLFTVVAIAAILIIAPVALDQTSPVARALSWPPLMFLGIISYGVYLWHWPVFMIVNGERTGWSGIPLFLLRCAITLAGATASWRLVEQPIRRWRPVRVPLLPLAAAATGTAVAMTILIVPVVEDPSGPVAHISTAAAVSPSTPVGKRPVARRGAGAPTTVAVFGDSIAGTLMQYLPETPGYNFIDHTVIGCSIVRAGPYRYSGQVLDQKSECDDWPGRWAQQIARDQPDIAMLMIGRWETVDRVNEGTWTHIGDPAFDTYLATELRRALDVLGSTGARVIATTVPYSRYGEQPNGSLFPEDRPDRVVQWNRLLRRVLARRPDITLLDLNKKLSPVGVYTTKVDGIKVRSDGVHLTREGVRWLAPWLQGSIDRTVETATNDR